MEGIERKSQMCNHRYEVERFRCMRQQAISMILPQSTIRIKRVFLDSLAHMVQAYTFS